jgi:uncharacterized membrane protein YccC
MMVRAALAVCGPLALGVILATPVPGLLGAMGGLLGSVVDRGGTYPARIRRIGCAATFGAAAGLCLGALVHGRPWALVVMVIAVSGLSALLTGAGATASITGLQLLIYTVLGTGPLGTLRPWWWPPVLLLAGAAWAIVLLIPGWIASPLTPERRTVAAAYSALADLLRAAGTDRYPEAHQQLVTALNAAWDDLASRRARSSGRDPGLIRIAGLLNQTHPLTEAATTLIQEGEPPPAGVIAAMAAMARAIRGDGPVPPVPAVAGNSPGGRAMAKALADAVDLLAGKRRGEGEAVLRRPPLRDRIRDAAVRASGGRFPRIFALRLMISMGVAALVSQEFALQRSYWVMLTVAIVLRPDFGSVFARALQRGLGTVVGAVLGALIIVVVPYGPWLLLPLAVLAGLLPYGRDRNWGLFSTFLTPLVVILIDLLDKSGWPLALDRLIDTLLGCAIVLLVGYAPWPSSWHAHLPEQFAAALDSVARYLEQALGGEPGRSPLRRQTYRALSDLRTEFQRTMAEPRSVSGAAARLWPAVLAVEDVMDAVTAVGVRAAESGQRPSPADVARLTAELRDLATAVRSGAVWAGRLPPPRPGAAGPEAQRVADAIAELRRALAGERAA